MEEKRKLIEELPQEERKIGMKLFWFGLAVPTVIFYLFMAIPVTIGKLHIFGWAALVMGWYIVVIAVIYHRRIDRIQMKRNKE
jgi:hypothetical protein